VSALEGAEPLRAGYVPFGSSFYDQTALREITARAEAELEGAGIRLTRTDPVVTAGDEVRALAELASGDWDFLIANVINWIDVRSATRVLLALRDRPVVLYSYGGRTQDGLLVSPAAGAGSTALRYPLERWGVRASYLFNGPDTAMDTAGVVTFGQAARAARRLRTARIGVIGWHDMGLYTTAVDVTQLRGAIGPEVEGIDLLQLERAAAALSDEEVADEALRVTARWEFPAGVPPAEVVQRCVRLYLATLALVREHGLDAVGYKTVEGVSRWLGVTHNMPSSLVATAGIPYADENDVLTLVAQLMLRFSTAEHVTFLEHYEHAEEWALLGVDGFVPEQLIDGAPRIKPVGNVITGELDGIAHCSRLRTGRLTTAALAEAGAGYRMHIAAGEALEPLAWEELGVPGALPSVRFIPDGGVRALLDAVLSQHCAAAFGDHAAVLSALCGLLEIEMVVT
jgi:L-fucose isomerase-like protein